MEAGAVFGQVLGDGLDVVCAISVANVVRLGFFPRHRPQTILNPRLIVSYFQDNLIIVLMSVLNDDKAAPTADYDPATQTLRVNLDLGADGFIQVPFAVDVSAPTTSIRLSWILQ